MKIKSYQKANFEGLADNYSQNRPQYPQRMLTKLRGLLPEGALNVVDLASGTGISTRAIAKTLGRQATIIGIEPSEDMRRRAQEGKRAGGQEGKRARGDPRQLMHGRKQLA